MITREWAAIHRKHHARCETAEDPHSPQVLGLGTVMGNGVELYRAARADRESIEKYGKGCPARAVRTTGSRAICTPRLPPSARCSFCPSMSHCSAWWASRWGHCQLV